GRIAVGEATVSDDVKRLAVEDFLEITVLAALLLHEGLRGRFRAGAEDLHHVVARRLPGVPGAASAFGSSSGWLLGRLGGSDRGWLGWRWSRLHRRGSRDRLGCRDLSRRRRRLGGWRRCR